VRGVESVMDFFLPHTFSHNCCSLTAECGTQHPRVHEGWSTCFFITNRTDSPTDNFLEFIEMGNANNAQNPPLLRGSKLEVKFSSSPDSDDSTRLPFQLIQHKNEGSNVVVRGTISTLFDPNVGSYAELESVRWKKKSC
jgi:hypothetical protein